MEQNVIAVIWAFDKTLIPDICRILFLTSIRFILNSFEIK